VVGGLALLIIAGLFLFAGIRRGWFEKRSNEPSIISAPVVASARWKHEEAPVTVNQPQVHEVDGQPIPGFHY
jgi:hypothetical protein